MAVRLQDLKIQTAQEARLMVENWRKR